MNSTIQDALENFKKGHFVSAVQMLEPLADAGDICAIDALIGVYSDELRRRRMQLLDCAKGGHATAQWEISKMYRFGDGMPQSLGDANMWLSRAAASDHAGALYELHQYHEHGLYEFTKDASLSEKFLARAVNKEHPEALFSWAMRHFDNGRPSPVAVDLLKRSAKAGFAHAAEALVKFGIES